jgi:heptosyltransferase II
MNKVKDNTSYKIFYDQKNNFGQKEFQSIDLKKKIIKKILIIKWGGMGDIIISTAIIEDILKSFPNAKVDINTLPQWQIIFKNHLGINKIWGSKNKKGINTLIHLYKWIKIVKMSNYDLIIDLQTNDRSRIYLSVLKLLSNKIKYIIGNHAVKPYSIFPKTRIKITNPFQMMQRTINSIGIKSNTFSPKIYTSKKDSVSSKSILKGNFLKKNNFVVLICGSNKRGKNKRWGAKNFNSLADLIKKKFKYKSVLIGGPDDINECLSISKKDKTIINLCNKTNLIELIEIFSNARFIISNDTGTAHLASSTKTPMIVITGPTDPKKVKPFGKKILAVQANSKDMNGVTPADILYNIIKIL